MVPPATGIVHQVNLEYLARVTMIGASNNGGGQAPFLYPDTLVGTDSHTTMINGLGVLGWGVGGIEAEAAMLGQAISMLIPQVVGFRLSGVQLPEGATATDLVLRVVEMLRAKGVVGKFVEFFGPGLAALPLADRATIANMAPEYGATCGIFPVDQVSLDYLTFTGRPDDQVALVEAYMKEQGTVPHLGKPGGRVLRYAGARPLHRRAQPGRTQASPGSHHPERSPYRLPRQPRQPQGEEGRRSDGVVVRQCVGRGWQGDGVPRRRELRAAAWLGGHRGHHQLHQHLQSVGHGGRRPAGPER